MGGVAWFFALATFAILGAVAGFLMRRRPIAAVGALMSALIPPVGMAMIPIFC